MYVNTYEDLLNVAERINENVAYNKCFDELK